jgi:hypothetical protein
MEHILSTPQNARCPLSLLPPLPAGYNRGYGATSIAESARRPNDFAVVGRIDLAGLAGRRGHRFAVRSRGVAVPSDCSRLVQKLLAMRYRLRTLLIVSATLIVVLGLAIGTDAGRDALDRLGEFAWAWIEANVLFLIPKP